MLKSTFEILTQHALLKRTSLINHKDSWCMHWTDRVFFPFAFKKGRKHWGYLWVSNSIGMLMLITRVGVILMELTQFPLALKGQARNFSINRDSSSGQPQPKTGYLNAPKRFPFITIWTSWCLTPLTGTNLQRLGYARGKQYEIISQCPQFFQLFFCWA